MLSVECVRTDVCIVGEGEQEQRIRGKMQWKKATSRGQARWDGRMDIWENRGWLEVNSAWLVSYPTLALPSIDVGAKSLRATRSSMIKSNRFLSFPHFIPYVQFYGTSVVTIAYSVVISPTTAATRLAWYSIWRKSHIERPQSVEAASSPSIGVARTQLLRVRYHRLTSTSKHAKTQHQRALGHRRVRQCPNSISPFSRDSLTK